MRVIACVFLLGMAGCSAPCTSLRVVTYSPEYQAKLAEEIKQASAGSVWPDVVLDYRHLREAVRECRKLDPIAELPEE